MIRRFSLLVFAIAMLLPAMTARASLIFDMPTIDVGHWYFEEGTGVVEIPIYVVGNVYVTDIQVRAIIGDDLPTPDGAPNMPKFVGADYIGTLWGDIVPDTNELVWPQYLNSGASLPAGLPPGTKVLLNGLLLTLKIDLTGLTAGQSFSLNLGGIEPTEALDAHDGIDHPILITNGSINIVPEPASLALIGAGLALMFHRRKA